VTETPAPAPGPQTPGRRTPGHGTPGEQSPGQGTPAQGTPAQSSPGQRTPGQRTVVIWIVEGTWHGVIDAAREFAPAGARLVLLHVTPEEVPGAGHGAYAGLLGRGRPERDPGTRMEALAGVSAGELLDAAARRLALPSARDERRGRVEREVVLAADGADLLILARDGDQSRLGPKSLGRASRFVVDHAPCPVLLVWPAPTPGVETIPPPPPGPPSPHPPPPKRHGHRGHGPPRDR
jgi:nucleotide-binding universal stress UspA family protein